MHLRLGRLGFVAIAVAALAVGCIGGQSGTESGGGKRPPPVPGIPIVNIAKAGSGCPCALSGRPAVALRGRVVRVDDEHVRVRVRTVLGEGPIEPELRFAPGDEIGGAVSEPGCEPTPRLQAGDDVAVLHVPGAQTGLECPEYRSCMSQQCDSLLAGDPRLDGCEPDCQQETRAQCSTRGQAALLDGRMVIARWDGELSLPLVPGGVQGYLRVPVDDVTDLLDQPVCEALFTEALPDAGMSPPSEPGSEVIDPGLGSAAAD